MLLVDETRTPQQNSKKTAALLIAIGVHALIILIAGLIIVMPKRKHEPEIVAAVVASPEVTEVKIEKKEMVKQAEQVSSSAAASPIAKMIRAQTTAVIAAPEVTKITDGPIGLGEGQFGSGFGSGFGGNGMGSGATFFGTASKGNRFLFVIDHSQSMTDSQIQLRNNELERALKSMSGGVQYQILLFAGPAWFAEKGWTASSNGKTVKDDRGKTYTYTNNGAYNFKLQGSDAELPKSKWLPLTGSNISQTMGHIRSLDSKKVFGTDWELALRTGQLLKPAPDVIFFMSDGRSEDKVNAIVNYNKKSGKAKINTVAMQTSAAANQFDQIASRTGGTFVIVGKNGKPIKGKDYLKDPSKYRAQVPK